jgi:hypothetical protein
MVLGKSGFGTFRTEAFVLTMSAHRGKADLAICARVREGPYASGATASRSSIRQGAQPKLIDEQPVARKPMQKPPLDPDVADTAPSDSVLTGYDEEPSSRICACSTRMRKVLTGAKSHASCCILIRNMNAIARGGCCRRGISSWLPHGSVCGER